jgi:hypothetical protein
MSNLSLARSDSKLSVRRASVHDFALAVAKRAYCQWQRKTLYDVIDRYQELCTKCYIAETACRAADRAPHLYPEDERQFWLRRRAILYGRLVLVEQALSVLVSDAKEAQRFAWWKAESGVSHG